MVISDLRDLLANTKTQNTSVTSTQFKYRLAIQYGQFESICTETEYSLTIPMQFIKIEQSVVGIIYGISLTIFMICAVLAMIKVKRKMKKRKLDKPNYRLGNLVKLTKVSSVNSSYKN